MKSWNLTLSLPKYQYAANKIGRASFVLVTHSPIHHQHVDTLRTDLCMYACVSVCMLVCVLVHVCVLSLCVLACVCGCVCVDVSCVRTYVCVDVSCVRVWMCGMCVCVDVSCVCVHVSVCVHVFPLCQWCSQAPANPGKCPSNFCLCPSIRLS